MFSELYYEEQSAPHCWIPYVDPVLGDDSKFHLGGFAKDAYEGMKTFMDFKIITGDETWVHNFIPDTKSASMTWKHPNSHGPNAARYCITITKLMSAIRHKRQRLLSRGVLFLDGNAIAEHRFLPGWFLEIDFTETDISGPFFIDEERSLAIEFSVPLASAQLAIASGMVSSNRDPFMILAVYSMPVWIVLFVTAFVISAAACLIYQILPAPEKRRIPEAYSKYLWVFQTGLIGQGFGENKRWFLKHVWSSPSFRLLQSLWFVAACVIFMYTYQGAIVSAFAADKLKPRISTIEELLEDTEIDVGTVANSYPMNFYKRLVNTSYESIWFRMENHLENLQRKGTIPGWLYSTEDGKMVFIAERFWLRNLIGERFMKTGKCALRATDTELGATYVAFAFRKQLRNESVFINFNKVYSRDNVVPTTMPVIKQGDTNEDCAKALASTENKLAEDANASFIEEKSVKDRSPPKQGVKLVNGDLLPIKATQMKETKENHFFNN
ncbi:hypothetical protein AVEN_56109-1 [Araneus ventricosus]|uniref:Ionotropic glutamate receptor C-terminal domain-containing protein n=1 Tax=Araneus ventricosus TaxID=182803 RepID=A0A4Y2GSB2_ARAVE|nr:hypothetical protein AVEN_56109-1 [Araneus ventricosus]